MFGRVRLVAAEGDRLWTSSSARNSISARMLHVHAPVLPRSCAGQPQHRVPVEQVAGVRARRLAELVGEDPPAPPRSRAPAASRASAASGCGYRPDRSLRGPIPGSASTHWYQKRQSPLRRASRVGRTKGWTMPAARMRIHQLGAPQAEHEAGPASPVVAHHVHRLVDPERRQSRARCPRRRPRGRSRRAARRSSRSRAGRARSPGGVSARGPISRRHIHQCWGQPWSSSSGGPSPASATCIRSPPALTKRCETPSTSGIGRSTARESSGAKSRPAGLKAGG